jgi:hypothetical protein
MKPRLLTVEQWRQVREQRRDVTSYDRLAMR